ncbi:beta-lactamase family protein [bacterium]|nr:beta-lactamase family protein [bacterium]
MKQEITVPEEVGMSSKRLDRIRPIMQAYVDQKKIAGLSTMIARKGKVVHFEQVGQLDKESNKPMTEDAVFRIYSMTKPIICVALMTLYEQGRFQLNDTVAKFIPAFDDLKVLECDEKGEAKEVDLARPPTVRSLLTHTSGLSYDFLEDYPVAELYRQAGILNNAERTLEELVHELSRLPLAFQPDSNWHYSLGIDVAARLIEIISGQALEQFLKENIFDPLGMVDTGFSVAPEEQHRIATMYGLPDLFSPNMTMSKLFEAWSKGFNERIDVSATYPTSKSAAFARGGHGLFSTSWDYLRFAQMLLNQGELAGVRILGRKTVNLLHKNYLPDDLLPYVIADPPAFGYGFGLGSRVLLNVAESEKPGSVGEFGWAGAAKTYYWVDPQEEIIGILMSQSMMQFEKPEVDFQVLTYQALID